LPYPIDISEIYYEIRSGIMELISENPVTVNMDNLTKAQKRKE
jgi:hypothetical protein